MKIIDDRGSMLIDFLGFGVLLQLPVLLLATQFTSIQSQQLAADSIARHSLRSFVLQGVAIETTAQEIARDFRLDSEPIVDLICNPDCNSPQSVLRLTVVLGDIRAASVMIR